MRRVLIIANTYYQMIVAMQLKNTLLSNDKVVLILTNHSKGMDIIAKRLADLECFEQCTYIETLGIVSSRNSYEKINDYFQISFMKDNRYSIYLSGITDLYFDEMICYNFAIDIYGLFSYLYKYNKDVKVSIFEEGILSYNFCVEETKRRKLINFSRKLLGKQTVFEVIDKFYCFHKKLYKGSLPCVQIPSISIYDITARELKTVFELANVNGDYKQKYIFFTSVYDLEGASPIGEYELVAKVSELVGKENILVKTHPRDKRTIYEDNGFSVDHNSSIPWEAVQLSGDFSNKIFLTTTSGSVLAGSFLSEKPVKTFYMYKCCNINGNELALKTVADIEALLSNEDMKTMLNNVDIVNDINEIL